VFNSSFNSCMVNLKMSFKIHNCYSND
jgi:hypothetical protein